jgi:hypothetical protein
MIGIPRMWYNMPNRVFVITEIDTGGIYANCHYVSFGFDQKTVWKDRLSFILNNSIKLSPVLKEIYES